MDGARHLLVADAPLPEDEDGGVGGRHLLDGALAEPVARVPGASDAVLVHDAITAHVYGASAQPGLGVGHSPATRV
jgi:hypothetical protein